MGGDPYAQGVQIYTMKPALPLWDVRGRTLGWRVA